jgi:hypothetical protein
MIIHDNDEEMDYSDKFLQLSIQLLCHMVFFVINFGMAFVSNDQYNVF